MNRKLKIVASLNQEDWLHQDLELADIWEIRLDLFQSDFLLENVSFLQRSPKPLLFCYRNEKDSSMQIQNYFDQNHQKVIQICENSSNFIDIELNDKSPKLQSFFKSSYQKIYSYHNFQEIISKEKIIEMVETVPKNQNPIFKFAVFPKNLDDAISFLNAIKSLSKQHKIVGICMGKESLFSRIFANWFGSLWTYACVTNPKAPGQLSLRQITAIQEIIES